MRVMASQILLSEILHTWKPYLGLEEAAKVVEVIDSVVTTSKRAI